MRLIPPLPRRSLQVVGPDGRGLRQIDLEWRRLGLAAGLVVLILVALGFALGTWWERRSESSRIAELEAEAVVLRADQARMADLARQLDEMELGVGRLRGAMTEGRPQTPEPEPVPLAATAEAVAPADGDVPAWPLARPGFVTRSFGSRPALEPAGHTGLDIAVPIGSYVRAIAAGTVLEAGRDEVYGSFVRVAHGGGLTSLYGHNSWLFASAGDRVERLQVIALTGNSGRSTAPHLHLELTQNGSLVDPLTVVSDHGSLRGSASVPTDPR